MLNYIRAELYKVVRRKYFYLLVGLMLLGELLFGFLWVLEGQLEFAYMLSVLDTTMLTGLFLTIPLGDMVFSEQYKYGTLKNEISFGISRTRVYMGKLLASILVALLACGIMIGFFLGFCWMRFAHSDPEAERVAFGILGYVLAASLPLWLGALGLAFALFSIVRSGTAASIIMVLGLTLGPTFLGILTMLNVEKLADFSLKILNVMLPTPFSAFREVITTGVLVCDWVIGMAWFLGATIIGITTFQKKEL